MQRFREPNGYLQASRLKRIRGVKLILRHQMILNKYVAGLERLRVNGFGSRQRCALEADAFKGKPESRG